MGIIKSAAWNDYSLIDCGFGKKLERFGKYTFVRPEPNAIWKSALTKKEWDSKADASFVASGAQKGNWIKHNKINSPWSISVPISKHTFQFSLDLTSFKHVGIFPEQYANWELIFNHIKAAKSPVKMLNLFAYTGAASVVGKGAGADVYHVDSVKQVVNWARRNMESSRLTDIRWVLEDALKFAERELKREKKYQVIVMDPPAYGIGAKGERWKLEDSIGDLIDIATKLLDPKQHLLIVNTYSPAITPATLVNFISEKEFRSSELSSGELCIESDSGFVLPFGAILRLQKI
jgi:23S rRNA (cytosine1962-C5)-methyltransferase